MKLRAQLSRFLPTMLGVVFLTISVTAQDAAISVTAQDPATHIFRISETVKPSYEFNLDSKIKEIHVINESDCNSLEILIGMQKLPILKKGKTTFKFTELKNDTISVLDIDTKKNLGEFASFRKLNFEVKSETGCNLQSGQIEKTSEKGKKGNDGANNVTSTYLYIPTFEEEQAFVKNEATYAKTQSSETCCPGTYELVFDYQAQCLVPTCDLENCICKKCKKTRTKRDTSACDTCMTEFKCPHRVNALHNFHPRVGDGLRVRVQGTNPYRDQLLLHIDMFDRNKEGKDDFLAYLDQFAKKPEAAADSTKTKPKVQNANTDNLRKITLFQKEMVEFYLNKYEATQLNPAFLAQCIVHIQKNIKIQFEIPAATPELMHDKFNIWFDDTDIDKAKYRAQLKDGLENYKKILNYQTSNAWLFQITNSDITKLDFEWLRNGQKISSTHQTFEFFNKGGFTIDFSVGININFLVNNAYTALIFVDSSGGTTYKIEPVRGSTFNLGPAVLAHAYYRYPILNRFKIGVTTGFMTNTLDADLGLNYLIGSSLLFGHEQRFNLSTGVVLGKVSRLAEGLKVGQTYPLGQTTDIPLRNIHRARFFIGISYNLGQ